MNTPLEHDYAPGCDLYDRFLGSVLFEPYAIDLASRVADLSEGAVLEMACGTGILTEQTETAERDQLETGRHRKSALFRRII